MGDAPSNAGQSVSKKRRVLLVDDAPDILKVVAKRLELAGFQVEVAMDGEAALLKVREYRPEIIILDVMLPKLDGHTVCRLLKQDPATRPIPVIMFTAKAQEKDYWEGMASGADAYLTKPFKSEDLQQLIQRFIVALDQKLPPEQEASGAPGEA